MLFAKQSLLLIDENEFDSQKNQKFSTNAERSSNVYRDYNGNKSRFKKRAYVVNENEKKNINEIEKIFHKVDDNVYYNENLKYYYSNNYNENEKPKSSTIHFVALSSTTFVYRQYNKQFAFNNQLHLYLRINCFCIQKSFVDVNNIKKSFANTFLITLLITLLIALLNAFVYFTKLSSIDVTKIFNNKKLFIIRFNVNVFKNVNINYNFRD